MRKPFRIIPGTAVLLVVASISALVVYFSSCGRRPLKEQLYQEVTRRFPSGTSIAQIEAWAKSQPAQTGTFRGAVKGVGDLHEDEAMKAGLDTSKVFCVIRSEYGETRCLDRYVVYLFFFFDQNDKLMKVWTSEWLPSF